MRFSKQLKIHAVEGENIVIRQAAGVADMTNVVGLNESAVAVCRCLAGHEFTVADVASVLCNEYEVTETQAATDAAAWVEAMQSEGLIEY